MSFRIYILFLFEYFRSHKLGTFFALSGISLGVGLFISTTANGIKAEKSLTDFAMGYFQGEYKIKISSSLGDQNLPVSLIRELSEDTNLTWIKKIVPRFQKEIIVNDSVRAVYIGLDFLKESGNLRYKPDAEHVESLIFISSSLSKKIDISKINIRADSRKFTLAKPVVLETEGGSILMEDIESAMERFDLKEHVSFLLIQPNEFRSEQKKILEQKLGPDYRVETVEDIQEKSSNALRSFQLNLLVISFISLVIALFMVSNTMSGLYFSREKELGILKTMGLNAKQTFSLFISQALLLGSVGSLLGLGLGLLFSRLEFFSPETTSADLSYLNTYQSLPFSAWFLGLGIGIIGSFLSAALPSFRAGKISPVSILKEATSQTSPVNEFRLLSIGIFSIFIFVIVAFLPLRWKFPVTGLIGIGGIVIGFTLCFPWIFKILIFFLFKLEDLSDRSLVFIKVGLEEIKNQSLRNTLTSATLMLATSLVVCLSILTDSYRRSLNDWVETEFPAEFTIINTANLAAGIQGGVPQNLLNELSQIQEIRSLDGFFINTRAETNRGNFTIHAYTFATYDRENSPERIIKMENEILISSNMAYLQNFNIDDSILIETKYGKKEFKIRGIKEHFFSERGTIMMDIKSYKRFFDLSAYNSIKIFLKKDSNSKDVEKSISQILEKNPNLKLFNTKELKELYTEGVNKVFGVLETLKITALIIAMLSLISSLFHNLISKKNTLGILKYLGADQRQLGKILLTESIFITIVSVCFGILLAFFLSPIVLYVVNKNAFGWTLKFTVSPEIPIFFLVLSPILGVFSCLVPLYTLQKLSFRISQE
ncbi:FtsX-like permease family protein [Leptospira interrogans]|uniref:FtsX-like permease family protein n=6 Tax=Leptospira interrogans TaxID=173 RepID=A0AAV9FQ14_LEPIR|nr:MULTISPECIES: FtsX-like permease family protein [Leptospira]EMF44234.1 MacB-like periplasmic core domain protein [Leptospira interrogans serovar Lora str. TE 1992]AKH77887.1 ABC transporter permease [Leptospira interrogans serovar Bratislava]ALE40238.1 ABC transporter integral membrane protein [Leptospira interrogans serovar Hardjo str. Norma]ALO01238.1 ABC transporter permease [Leptospira interrogans serovar Hardjo-prajitno]EKO05818.1 MacB-like periplasmic core domain protein [Leptospira i